MPIEGSIRDIMHKGEHLGSPLQTFGFVGTNLGVRPPLFDENKGK